MKKIVLLVALALFISLPTQSLAAMKYSDVNNRTQNAILEKLSAEKIVSGTSATHFTPNKSVTRGEMAVFLNRAFQLERVRAAGKFNDVKNTHPYYNEIQALYQAGIVSGYNGNYMPNKPVTREQVAIVFARLLELEKMKTTKFKDVPASHASNTYIGALVNKGITVGFPDGTFGPSKPVTRIQFATFLYRGLYGKEPVFPNRVIKSAKDYYATKISTATYNHAYGGNLATINFKFDRNGSANDKKSWVMMNGLSAAFDGTDHIFFNMADIVGLEQSKTRSYTAYYADDYEEEFPIRVTENVYFDQTIKIGKQTFTNAIKVTSKTSDYNDWDTYLIEGFGVVKTIHKGKTYWEMTSFTLR